MKSPTLSKLASIADPRKMFKQLEKGTTHPSKSLSDQDKDAAFLSV